MPISNFPSGFAHGVNIRGLPLLSSYGGKVFWIDSVNGSDGNSKATFDRPMASLNGVMDKCTANRGDIIMAKPGHAENVSTALTQVMDVAGVALVGLGAGSLMPTFTFTATGGSFEIDAANVLVANVRFLTSISAVVVGVNIDANYVTLSGCQFDWDATGDDFLIMVDAAGVTHFAAEDCKFEAEVAAGAAEAIRLNRADNARIVRNQFFGDFSAAVILGDSDTAGGASAGHDLLIANNLIYNADTAAAQNGIDINDATTGVIADNRIGTLQGTDVHSLLDPGSCLCLQNYAVNAVNEHGLVTPTTAAT